MRGAVLVAAAALLAGATAGRAEDAPPPDLRGVWSGEGPTSLSITDQLGTALEGRLSTGGADRPIYGVIQRDRKEIMFINPEGNRRGELQAPDEMEFCLEAREDFKFVGPCPILRRERAAAPPDGT